MGKQSSMFRPLPQGSYEDGSMDDTLSINLGSIRRFNSLFEHLFKVSPVSTQVESNRGASGGLTASTARMSNHGGSVTFSLASIASVFLMLLDLEAFDRRTSQLIANYDDYARALKTSWLSLSDEEKQETQEFLQDIRQTLKQRDAELTKEAELGLKIFSWFKGRDVRQTFFEISERTERLIATLLEAQKEMQERLSSFHPDQFEESIHYDIEEGDDQYLLPLLSKIESDEVVDWGSPRGAEFW